MTSSWIPFPGSATTITVAKKLGREFLSFELSKEYAKLGRKRLNSAAVGDKLAGAEEPKVSAPATNKTAKTDKEIQRSTTAGSRLTPWRAQSNSPSSRLISALMSFPS